MVSELSNCIKSIPLLSPFSTKDKHFPWVYLRKQSGKVTLCSQKPDLTNQAARFSNTVAVILNEQEEGSGSMDGQCIHLSEGLIPHTSIMNPSCISEVTHSEHGYTQRSVTWWTCSFWELNGTASSLSSLRCFQTKHIFLRCLVSTQ